MAITAAMVKELRERTGAGMMECKKALVEAEGNLEAAVEAMRISGLAKADKKAGRVAAEGVVALAVDGAKAAMVEVNCETDFVSKGDDFAAFAQAVADLALASGETDVAALSAMESAAYDGKTIELTRQEMIARIGENIQVRRAFVIESASGAIGQYSHGGRIGVLVAVENGDADLGKDLAMHIAASRPSFVNNEDVDAETVERERRILMAEAADSGKPQEIIEKMVDGRIRKFFAEITLVGQPFVKDPEITVAKLLGDKGASVSGFMRFEVGEGIEKEEVDFATEVMQQAAASSKS